MADTIKIKSLQGSAGLIRMRNLVSNETNMSNVTHVESVYVTNQTDAN